MKLSFTFSLIMNCLVNSLIAQDSTRTQLFYGPNNAYYLTAPTGWVMDNEAGKEQGMTAVFYPLGSNWVDGETVMYTTFASYDSTKNETLQDFILNDSIKFKQNSFKPTIIRQKPIVIGKDKKASVYSFSDHDNKHYELIAYMGESKGVVMVVMTSTNKNGCINNYKSFQSLVKSYRFLTDKVNIQIGK